MSAWIRGFVRTYLLALIPMIAIVFALQIQPGLEAVPAEIDLEAPVLAPYSIEVQTPGAAEARMVEIGPGGMGCQLLDASRTLMDACNLALNVEPTVIAGSAYGRLNTGHTATYEAILWRATLNGDPGFCDRAGLLGESLASCRDAAANLSVERVENGVSVTIRAATPANVEQGE